MNIISHPVTAPPETTHRAAIDDVNRWRGRCVECFSRIEQASIFAVQAMVDDGREATLKVKPMLGQRLAGLRMALETDKFGPPGRKCLKALNELDPALTRRNLIVHATGDVWIDGKESWLWRYRFVTNARSRTQEIGTIDKDEAQRIEDLLSKRSRSLSDCLRNLANGLKSNTIDAG